MNRYKDITNQQFGSLKAISLHHFDDKRQAFWLYKCNCGNTHIARANTITYIAKQNKANNIPSCGCVELANKTKHGYRKAKNTHPLYRAYRSIISRCYDVNSSEYQFYGAKGVTICDEWKGNPKAFIEWGIENGWKKGLSIDKDVICNRLNINPKIYSPLTCIFLPTNKNSSFSRSRYNTINNSRLILNLDKCREIYDEYLKHTYPSKNQFNLAMCKKYGLKSTSTVIKALKAYQTYIKNNELNEQND